MKRTLTLILAVFFTSMSASLRGAGDTAGKSARKDAPTTQSADAIPLYTQSGTDPTFETLMAEGRIPTGHNSNKGVTGSIIHVNRAIIDKCPTGKNPIDRDIDLHTLCDSHIPRKEFSKWTRWYQEDGNTQIFRLFAGEDNVRNKRPLAARVETFSKLHWAQGSWHEWEGTYTLVKPQGGAIFQIKNNDDDWAVMISAGQDGDVILQDRRPHTRKTLATNLVGKSFLLKARDNGLNYEVYFNGKKVDEGSYSRPKGDSDFRWGMYFGEHEIKGDAMIFVTGATVK